MLKGFSIIVFSDDWGRHPSSCQHLVNNLLTGNKVLWVNTICMRSPRFTLYDFKRSIEVVKGWFKQSGKVEEEIYPENLSVIKPVMLPFNGINFIRRFNTYIVTKFIKEKIVDDNINKLIVVTTFPCTSDFVGEFDELIHIYYCVDDFVKWPDIDQNLIQSMEEELIQKSDLVFATAKALMAVKERPEKKINFLPHGVDFEHFNSTVNSNNPPRVLEGIDGPIIGFFGALSAWLDYELIVKLAKARPDWIFLFIGPADTDISCLSGHSNIRLIGAVNYDDLPSYASIFDVGIIPFLVNDLTQSVNPLKLLEYLSMGLPVVSSFMPEVERFSEVVEVAHSHDNFLNALDRCITSDTDEMRSQRINVARKYSWQAMAERFSTEVYENISKEVQI